MGDELRQVICIRKDLHMRRGKEIAQSCHASMAVFFDRMEPIEGTNDYVLHMTPEMKAWREGLFTKICLYVNSEAELLEVLANAEAAGLPCRLITDSGLTEFNGVPTNTCIAIGPATKADLDPITGHLPLY